MAEVNHREESSGNVFADLNIPEPSLYLAKAELANQICTVIQERNLTQVEAAEILGINQPKVSALTRGNLDGFSSDRLFKFLNLLGQDIEIIIRPHTDANQEAGIKVSELLRAVATRITQPKNPTSNNQPINGHKEDN